MAFSIACTKPNSSPYRGYEHVMRKRDAQPVPVKIGETKEVKEGYEHCWDKTENLKTRLQWKVFNSKSEFVGTATHVLL